MCSSSCWRSIAVSGVLRRARLSFVSRKRRHSRESGNPLSLLPSEQNRLTSFAVVKLLRFRGNDGAENGKTTLKMARLMRLVASIEKP